MGENRNKKQIISKKFGSLTKNVYLCPKFFGIVRGCGFYFK